MVQQSFQELYSAKTDEELLVLAADSASLREDAKLVLSQELQLRNLQQPPSQRVEPRPITFGRELRALKFGAFLAMNVTIAVIGTAILEVSLRNAIPLHSTIALAWEEYVASLICAAGLGFAAWQTWPNSSTKWTWVVPAVWFAFGFAMMAGHGPVLGSLFVPRSQRVLSDYTDARGFLRPFLRF